MAEKSNPMIPSASNLTTVPWEQQPTVPTDVGVVTSSQSQLKDLFGLFCMVTLNLIALLANVGVMVAIARAPHLKRFAFVCHLCAVDLLCAILLMPLGIISSSPFFGTVVFTVLECQVYIFLNVFLICLSILTITAISVERYFYIVHPMRYEVKMTINLAIGVMLLIWVKSALLALFTLFGWPAYGNQSSIAAAHCSLHASHSRLRGVFAVLFTVLCFLVPSVIIFVVYCAVYKVARSAALQQVPAVPTWASANLDKNRSDSISSQTTMINTTRSLPQRLSPERAFGGGKAALTLVFIVGQFLVCWLPYFIFHLQMSLTGSMHSPGDLEEAVNWLAFSSFAVNPFFYGLLNRQIREELVKFRRCCLTQPVEFAASSHEGSLQENFLQFIQRTSCTAERRSSCVDSSPRNTVDHRVKIPGQIPEDHT
ncbi:probable G-protein coupled receptor [Dunckerocampus dactyliophorus]|uniref:probable G-protein coupled receptor n=1 Tax=Dunckerocampus dactyliophorus TaxID=161453 RepID=UPI002406AD3E|nr:probable G-protein coupled receptor [Dunckerocampus dactyliophorus]